MINKATLLFLVLTLLATSFSYPQTAAANDIGRDVVGEEVYIHLHENVAFEDSQNEEELGEILSGTLLKALLAEDQIYVQWNKGWAEIKDPTQVDVVEQADDVDFVSENPDFLGEAIVSEKVEVVLKSEDNPIASLEENVTLFITGEYENYVEVILGGRIGLVNKDYVTFDLSEAMTDEELDLLEEVDKSFEDSKEAEDIMDEASDGDSEAQSDKDKDGPQLEEDVSSESAIDEEEIDSTEIAEDEGTRNEETISEIENEEDGLAFEDGDSIVKEEKEESELEEAATGVQMFQVQASSVSEQFTAATRYFEVVRDNVPVYDNSTGALIRVGTLVSGEHYPRVRDYGSWHEINFGNGKAYVNKSATIPSDGSTIKNINKSFNNSTNEVRVLEDTEVFDNSSGGLVQFATIDQGKRYPIIGTYGANWYRVQLADRIGYIRSSKVAQDFKTTDRYFEVIQNNVIVYDNSTGSLIPVGTVERGEVFPRVRDFGNWHEIKFGNGVGYVAKQRTRPHSGVTINNINTSFKNSSQEVSISNDAPVYDNSSGSLVQFARINKGQSYPIISTYGANWYRIQLADRVGYISSSNVMKDFTSTDKYFEANGDIAVYDSTSSTQVKIGTLKSGQVYPRVNDHSNWHEIKFGDGVGYVSKQNTLPHSGSSIENLNTNYTNSSISFVTLQDVEVYDNSTGLLVPFAILPKDTQYPIVGNFGSNWYRVLLADRVGYVRTSQVHSGPTSFYNYTQYNMTLNEALNRQMGSNPPPQTDLYRNDKAYVHRDFIATSGSTFPRSGTVTASSTLNVRDTPSTTGWILTTFRSGQSVTLRGQVGEWYEVQLGAWRNAKPADVLRYLDPNNFEQGTNQYYQFLQLSRSTGIQGSELNKILNNKGILHGRGQAFVDASNEHAINEIYLISHALLETGHGASPLATGIVVSSVDGRSVTPRTVYNMYGIGAFDGCAHRCGSEYAYKQGWFTPEAAIIGGAKFIGERYVHHPTRKQDTLYKMKWNPQNPGTMQYATDIGWAIKQVSTISNLYNQISNYTLYYDVPAYR
ncbi:glucosaminidase domain-containing protein [Alkalihalophilus marmarensis]|uniref:glucosaminidase domain-containing protein n=1 Tax=Alkalihalophilus marmarensis TaxID=521377 RepID=UPI002E1E4C26|nr:glucosaminidase domain-containing protein [Alkalihalophilus marmarensis]MED1602991.1 glucosaminidase domain-containing protein [Alkalihalophilus marmarensis]